MAGNKLTELSLCWQSHLFSCLQFGRTQSEFHSKWDLFIATFLWSPSWNFHLSRAIALQKHNKYQRFECQVHLCLHPNRTHLRWMLVLVMAIKFSMFLFRIWMLVKRSFSIEGWKREVYFSCFWACKTCPQLFLGIHFHGIFSFSCIIFPQISLCIRKPLRGQWMIAFLANSFE